MFLNYFDMLMSKIIFKNKKKYYFNAFPSKKYFEKQRNHTPKQMVNTLKMIFFAFLYS
jgi:hypothetical protein